MSDSNKRPRSLRPRAKLKRPEYFTSDLTSPSKPAGETPAEVNSPSLKKSRKSESDAEEPEYTKGRKRRRSKLNKRKRPSSNNLGGCTSINTGRQRSTQRERSTQRMEDTNQSESTQETPNPSGASNAEPAPSTTASAPVAQANPSQSSSSGNPTMDEQAEELRQLQSMLESRFPSNIFNVLGPRMQQIIRTTMMPMPNSGHARLIEQLSHVGIGALPALTDLCQMLCMGTEDNLVGFNYRAAVPLLITHLKDNEVEVSQHAARALTYLLESLPRSLQAVSDAIPALLERVACIHDDGLLGVAEQSLSCLEKLSARHGRQILLERGCTQVVLFLDFFSIVAQRHALAIVLSCFRSLEYGGREFHLLEDALPAVVSRLQSSDRRSMEFSIQSIGKLIDRTHTGSPEFITKLRHAQVVSTLIKVVCDPQNLSANFVTICLRGLKQLSEVSSEIRDEICQSTIPQALQSILTVDIAASPQREAQELVEAIKLATALLPKETQEKVISPIDNIDIGRDFLDDDSDCSDDIALQMEEDGADDPGEASEPSSTVMSEDQQRSVEPLIKSLYPLCWKLLNAAPNNQVRISVVQIVIRMSHSTSQDILRELLASQESQTCSQIQQLLDSSDTRLLVPALQLTRTVLNILPEFRAKFQREGLVHCLTQLSNRKLRVHNPSVGGPLSAPASLATTPSDPKRALRLSGSHYETRRPIGSKSNLRRLQRQPDAVRKIYSESDAQDASRKSVEQQIQEALEASKTEISKQRNLNDASTPLPIPTLPSQIKANIEDAQSSSATSGTLSGMSTPRLQVPPKGLRLRCDSQSRKEIELNWAKDEAKKILDEFFKDQDNEETQSELISELLEINRNLRSSADINCQIAALVKMEAILQGQDLSPFEIIHTKIMESLFEYLHTSSINQKEFLKVFAKLPKDADMKPSDVIIPQGTDLLRKLIVKIHQIISHVEKFPVKLFDIQAPGMTQLGQNQVKCILQKDPSCSKTKQWTSGPVKIDPLAPVSAIERHLVMKGYGFSNLESRDGSDNNESDSEDDTDQPSFIAFARGQRLVELSINGKLLPPNITIYQAIRECEESGSELSDEEEYQNMIWGRTFTITYRIIPKDAVQKATSREKPPVVYEIKHLASDNPLWSDGVVQTIESPIRSYFVPPASKNSDESTLYSAVSLLRGLFGLSRFWQTLYPPSYTCSNKMLIEAEEFENQSITSKVWRQLQDPLNVLSGTLPSWLTELIENSSFLLPFDARRYLFYITAFDRHRALQKFVERNPDHDMSSSRRLTSDRSSREKKIVDRGRILGEAEELFSKTKHSNAVIEVQYAEEVGTGLGPTLEFYTLVSKELQRPEIGLWRGHKSMEDNLKGKPTIVESRMRGEGLFPTPIGKSCKKGSVSHMISKFKLFGRVLGRAVKDSRLLDLPLSPLMCRYLLSEEATFTFRDLFQLDAQLARSLQQLHTCAANGDADSIDELYLDFILPGYSNFELMKGGKSKAVNGDNLSKYIDLVSHWTMIEGVRRQFQAIKIGFNEVCNLNNLKIFHPWELPRIFCGSERARWTINDLESALRPDHGYSSNCRAVQFLYTVLSELTGDEQADFLRFATGSPHLPVGGLKSLNPPLTVVKKTVDDGENPENYLPSVMTCQNYLKLPDYSSLQIMREKLLLAISEGQGAFLLS